MSKDFFSKQSDEYSVSRPTYPRPLFDFLASLVDRKEIAWDCATGNGQAAIVVSEYFRQVIASDMSKRQIENAKQKSNVRYEVFPAEKTTLEDNSVDLVTVAQALHWFNFDEFYKEVRRVLRKDGVIAAWAYGLHSTSPDVDKVTYHLYEDILGEYWPKERKYIENRYEDIPFPFEQIPAPQFEIRLDWSLSDLMNYLYTWSSTQQFIAKNNYDPVKQIKDQLERAWGDQQKRQVVWPIYMKVGLLPAFWQ
ncbi:MAG: class I SAM-dependent methyltransferase [Thermoproteota archaeon]